MRLYKVVLLLNLAVGVGFLLGTLWWGPEVARLRHQVAATSPAGAAGQASTERWSARGIVRVVAPEINRIFIDHEAIPSLMEGMTMAFELQDAKLFDGLVPGDQVRFTLRKDGERLLLVAVDKIRSP